MSVYHALPRERGHYWALHPEDNNCSRCDYCCHQGIRRLGVEWGSGPTTSKGQGIEGSDRNSRSLKEQSSCA